MDLSFWVAQRYASPSEAQLFQRRRRRAGLPLGVRQLILTGSAPYVVPSGLDRTGGTINRQTAGKIPLLLVIHRSVRDLHAHRIGCVGRDGAGFAIRRHDNSTRDRSLAAFLDGQLQRVVVNLFQRPHV